jgi:hypothetical protein
MWITSRSLINYLMDNGLFPEAENLKGEAYFLHSETLETLLDSYTVRYECIPNKQKIPKRRVWLL